MAFRPFWTLLLLVAASGCGITRAAERPATVRFAVKEHHPECDILAMARNAADVHAVDCGRTLEEEEREKALACIRQAEGKPFVAILHYRGVDSTLIQAFLGTATGERWQLWYDSDPYGGDNPRRAVITRKRCDRIEPDPDDPSYVKCVGPKRGVSVCRGTEYSLGPPQSATSMECFAYDEYRPGLYLCDWATPSVTNPQWRPVPPGTTLACQSDGAGGFECSASPEGDDELGFPLDGWRTP